MITPEEFADRLQHSWGHGATLTGNIGVRFSSVSNGKARGRLSLTPELSQPNGFFHAGAILTLADNIATVAAYSALVESGEVHSELLPLAFQVSASLMRNTNHGSLHCEAEVIKKGRRIVVVEVAIKDDENRLVAKVAVTLLNPIDSAVSAP